MKWQHKLSKVHIVIGIAECLLLVIVLSGFFREKEKYIFDCNSMERASGIVINEEQGIYVDESYEYKGFFTNTQGVDLKRGVYAVTIEYNSENNINYWDYASKINDEFNYVICFKNTRIPKAVKCDNALLPPDKKRLLIMYM